MAMTNQHQRIVPKSFLKFFIILRLLQIHLCADATELQMTKDALTDSNALSEYTPSNLILQMNEVSPSDDVRESPISNRSKTEVLTDNHDATPRTSNDVSETIPDYLIGKHPSLLNCSLIVLEPGEYEVLPDGGLSVEVYNITYNRSMFFVTPDGMAHICEPKIYEDVKSDFKEANHLFKTANLTLVGLIISMICLFLHLVAFVLVPELRNLPGWNLASLCLSLFLSYALNVASNGVWENSDLCLAVGFLQHFFFTSSFLWMSVMSLDVYLSLLHVTGRNLRISSTKFSLKKFALYCACAFGVAFVLALLALLADLVEGTVPDDYRPRFAETCWFTRKGSLLVFFAAPVIGLTALNFLFFLLSACTIHQNKMRQDEDDHKSVLRRNYLTYFRLSVVMGITWVVGILAVVVNADWLWILFVALNVFQGLYIFLAFTCNAKVTKHFRLKFMGGRRSSEQTLSPTFQSYCFYANSIEKDLDKIVDSKTKDSKEVIDTVVIHL